MTKYIEALLAGEEVVWKTLGEVAEIKRGVRVTKAQLQENSEGMYPVISGGSKPLGYLPNFNRENDTITIAQYGTAGYIYWQKERFWANDVCYCVYAKPQLLNRFLYYCLLNKQQDIYSLVIPAAPSHLPQASLSKVLIPIPSLRVQRKIVEVLDNFTELTEELTAELTARRKQYEYFRNELLSFKNVNAEGGITNVKFLPLGEVAKRIFSGGTPSTTNPDYWDNGTIPWMSSGEVNLKVIDKTEKYISLEGLNNSSAKLVPSNSVVIALAGQGKTRGKVARTRIELATNQSLASLTFDASKISSDYVYYYLEGQYEKLRQISSGEGTRGGLNLQMISAYPIPLPPIEEQRRIVEILDQFDTLAQSIAEGLPREIELRRKQYEYYREQLLSFN